MGYIAGIFAIGPVIGAVILLLYGLVTDPIATILFVGLFVKCCGEIL